MIDDKFRKITEGLLSSVLISAKSGVPLHRLAQEYQEITLSEIPLQKLGYGSLELYIKSIPHCARIETDKNGVIVVKGVPNDTNKHIAKLVSGQKKNKKPSVLASSKRRGGFSRSRGLNVVRKSRGGSVQPRSSQSSLSSHLMRGSPRGHPGFNLGKRPPQPAVVHYQRRAFAPTGNSIVASSSQNNHMHKSASAPSFNIQGPNQILREVHNIQFGKPMAPNKVGSHASNYEPPPRMRNRLPQNKGEQNIHNMRDEGKDLRQVINERRQPNSNSVENKMSFTIKNDLVEQTAIKSDKLEGLREDVIEFLKKYPNGMWGGVFVTNFKKAYGYAPANLVDIIKRDMSDRVEVNRMMEDKFIINLKKEPVVIRKPLNEEKPAANEQLTESKQVVFAKSPPGNQHDVLGGKEPQQIDETAVIAEQEVPGTGETFQAYVCHVDTIDRFFVQKADSDIIQLSQKIQQYYQANSSKDMILKPRMGTMCCAFYIDQWYRARIIFAKAADHETRSVSLKGMENKMDGQLYHCKVLYIDYGNMESITSDMIRRLKPEFCTLPAQAIQCQLHDVTRDATQEEWSEEAIRYFKDLTLSDPFTVKVIDSRDKILDINMLDSNNKSVADTLANKGLAILESRRRAASLPNLPKFAVEGETPSTTTKEDEEALLGPKSGVLQRLSSLSIDDEEEDFEVSKVELPRVQYMDVLVSAVNSLTEVSAILRGNEYQDRLTILEAAMQAYYDCEQTEALDSIETDCVYAAFHEEAWYRVRVTEIREDEAEVYFVDRGDYGKVETCELRKLPTQFKRLPMQAVDLTLINLPESDNPDHIQVLSDMILGKECVAMTIEGPPEYTFVELYDTSTDEDININEKVAAQLNLNDEQDYEQTLPKLNEQCEAYIPFVSDSGIFNVVLSRPGLERLDKLIEDLESYYLKATFPAADLVNNPEQDKIVCTKWKEDGCLYRVKITCVMPTERKVEVEFIDYGNREVISFVALKEIPEHLKELRSLPPQTVRCRLADCPEEAETLWKYGLATRLVSELKTQTFILKVVREESEDDVASVELLKADAIDSSKFTSIAEDISTICSEIRESKSATAKYDAGQSESIDIVSTEDHKPGFRSPSSSTCSSDLNQDIDSQARAELSRRSMDSQSSFASSTSDLTVGKSGIMINGSGFPPLEIKDPWSVVHVATVVNPSLIYFQLQENIPGLITFIENMHEFYKDSDDPFEDCQIGDPCAAFIEKDYSWYRGIIRSKVEMDGEYRFGVFLADYGMTEFLPASELRKLDASFQTLSLQAVKASLAGVQIPPKEKWSRQICKELSTRVLDKLCYAHIRLEDDRSFPISFSYSSNAHLDIDLYDTSSEIDTHVNEVIDAMENTIGS